MEKAGRGAEVVGEDSDVDMDEVEFDLDSYLTGASDLLLSAAGGGGGSGSGATVSKRAKGRKPGEASSQVPLRSTQVYAALDDALAQLTKDQTITPELATHVRSVFDTTAPGLLVKAENFASGRGAAAAAVAASASAGAGAGARAGQGAANEQARKKKPPILITGKVENYSGIANNWSVSVKGAKITCTGSDGRVLSKRSVRELELRLTVSLDRWWFVATLFRTLTSIQPTFLPSFIHSSLLPGSSRAHEKEQRR